jgi:hypothetical protein
MTDMDLLMMNDLETTSNQAPNQSQDPLDSQQSAHVKRLHIDMAYFVTQFHPHKEQKNYMSDKFNQSE